MRMMLECWKDIPGFPNYEVSDQGKIKSLVNWRTLNPQKTKKGYLRVSLYKDRKSHSRSVHSCVLEAFVGPRPSGHHGAHLNGNGTDNRLLNLGWVTPKENEAHKKLHKRTPIGDRHGRSKLSHNNAEIIKKLYKISSPQNGCIRISNAKELAARFGVSTVTITNIVSGKNWSHLAADAAEDA